MNDLKTYVIGGNTFMAADCIEGVLIDPALPDCFDVTPNDQRPNDHDQFWNLPFISTDSVETFDKFYAERNDKYKDEARANWLIGRNQWMSSYPTGVRYCVRCLDGGAWDRPTNHGFYADINAAIDQAKKLMGIY